MKKIGVISDTHGFIPQQVFSFFDTCDEIWHAGDIGNLQTYNTLQDFKPVVAVYGNMDGYDLRYQIPKTQLFNCEDARILITHIGGYPGHYDLSILPVIEREKPKIFVAGHSHILRIMFDQKHNLLHINPGAAGHQGFHLKATLVRFNIENGTPKDLEYMEFDK